MKLWRRLRCLRWGRDTYVDSRYSIEDVFKMVDEAWEQRRPVETFTVFNDSGEPVATFDSRGYCAVRAGAVQ